MTAYWKTLSHNGVSFPDPYKAEGLSIRVKGRQVALTPLAEEMAYALAKKKDTPYVQDPTFAANFMRDFVKELPDWCRGSRYSDVDFGELFSKVDKEKAAKESISKQEKKALAAERKERREELKAMHGKAVLDGQEVEIANWMVEPPGLFMGRGCVSGDTIVMTSSGPRHVEEVGPGDMIATRHGSDNMFYKRVESVASQGVRPVLRLRTRTHSILATDNHPFLTLRVNRVDRRNSRGQFTRERNRATLNWVELAQLKRNDYVVVTKRYTVQGTRKFSNSAKRTFEHTIITPNLARVLGYYLGDGHTGKRSDGIRANISFSEGHSSILDRYAKICEDVFGIVPTSRPHSGGNSQVLSVYSREFADVLESMGVTGSALTKRVPSWVFGLADDLKCSFLRGYLDADGNFFTKEIKGVEYGSFGFETPNRRLIEDLRELAISAGLQVSNLTWRDNHGFSESRAYRFFISENSSVLRLLDSQGSMKGKRARPYILGGQANELLKRWDWSGLHILDSALYSLEHVLEIRKEGKAMTYDVSMGDQRDPNFVANSFVVHNSHPLRGKWKPRVIQSDVILNLDRSAKVPPGKWKKVVHDYNSMWMAKWIDKLTHKEKYVWLHESTPIQQTRNREKYDKAKKVGANLQRIRARILKDLDSKDPRIKQVATASYLIDVLGMRVGDEKDEDEVDTVGASTLRVEHVKVDTNKVKFDFLGKDSVRWKKDLLLEPSEQSVVRNLSDFTSKKKPDDEIFHHIDSTMVNQYLSSIVPGLTAKVFRTYHATAVANNALRSKDLRAADDLDKLYHE
ncbi:MAG TPA: LAGLIDADG family homing endonuclease, partial [Nitrososphaerales archaeon]|nr:LAGLIDADG family homing endonuclease [Nitrososphaerales archaeon]